MIMRLLITTLLLLCFVAKATAQSNTVFTDLYTLKDDAQHKPLRVRATNINFFKNNEYFGNYVEGYTLLGYRLKPTLHYTVDSALTVEAGAELVQFGGTDKYHKVYPVLCATWRINPTFTLTMGSIKGSTYHDLPEAILDPERQLSSRPETGVQVEARHGSITGEVWLDWQSFIFKGDTIPERFMAGVGLTYEPESRSAWQIRVPLRLTASHIGGQISDYAERMQSLANVSVAFDLTHKGTNGSYGFEAEGLYFYTMTGSGVRPFGRGWALHPKVKASYKLIDATAGLYHARNFFALHGNPLYMSLSDYNPRIYNRTRNMFTLEANLNHKINRQARFALNAKCYYDTGDSQLEYYYGFYLVITTL